jgi:hypothetical protein
MSVYQDPRLMMWNGSPAHQLTKQELVSLISMGGVKCVAVVLATLLLYCTHAYLIALYRVSSGKDAPLWPLKQLLTEYTPLQPRSLAVLCSLNWVPGAHVAPSTDCTPFYMHEARP